MRPVTLEYSQTDLHRFILKKYILYLAVIEPATLTDLSTADRVTSPQQSCITSRWLQGDYMAQPSAIRMGCSCKAAHRWILQDMKQTNSAGHTPLHEFKAWLTESRWNTAAAEEKIVWHQQQLRPEGEVILVMSACRESSRRSALSLCFALLLYGFRLRKSAPCCET